LTHLFHSYFQFINEGEEEEIGGGGGISCIPSKGFEKFGHKNAIKK
jgi:hypothetical protein